MDCDSKIIILSLDLENLTLEIGGILDISRGHVWYFQFFEVFWYFLFYIAHWNYYFTPGRWQKDAEQLGAFLFFHIFMHSETTQIPPEKTKLKVWSWEHCGTFVPSFFLWLSLGLGVYR